MEYSLLKHMNVLALNRKTDAQLTKNVNQIYSYYMHLFK